MNIESLSDVLLWSTLINYGFLLYWFLVFKLAHEWIYRLHGRWFRLSLEEFDAIHYRCMALYKVGIILFNLVPYIALKIVL